MAEDDGKGSGRSRFKSKWGKILKHSEEIKSNVGDSFSGKKGRDSNSQEDVAAFLKPSTDRAAANRPRLDVSIAQRWPEPNDVRQAGAFPPDGSQNVNGWRKRRRREGLTVGFVKTVPETIGHGGDETMDPPSDIAMRRARSAPAMHNRTASQGEGYQIPPPNNPEGPRIPPFKGQETSFNGAMPPHQGQHRPPHVEEPPPPPRIGISRSPTGFNTQDEAWSPISDYDDAPSLPKALSAMDAQVSQKPQDQDLHGAGQLKVSPTPRNPQMLGSRKHGDMRANEGMALRRASAMIEPLDFETEDDLDLGGYAAATAAYRADVAATPPVNAVEREPVIPPIDTPSPQSATSPDSPSPFADERYIKRHSREVPLAPPHTQPQPQEALRPILPIQGGRSPFADPKYLQPRSREASPARPPRRNANEQANEYLAEIQPARNLDQQRADMQVDVEPPTSTTPESRSRAVRPQNADMSFVVPKGPRDPSPEKSQRPTPRQAQATEIPSYMRAAQPTSHENVPPASARPVPAPRLMTQPQDRSAVRDASPLRDRIFDSPSAVQTPASSFGRPNGSNTSVNRFAPAPGGHSRNNSQEQRSPQSIQSGSDGMSPPRLHMTSSTTNSPPSQPGSIAQPQAQTLLAPRPMNSRQNDSYSSQLAPPKPSPYARGPSPNGYFDVNQQQPLQPARSPMANLSPSDASRPGSGHSNRSFLRPSPPSQTPSANNLAADAAFEDFAGRVAHMKGVFRLTAEKEQPAEKCAPSMWVRAAYWWYLRGRIGLETQLKQRAKSGDVEHRELLLQPHVDLAKTSWMLADPLENYSEPVPQDPSLASESGALLRRDIAILKDHLKSLSHAMLRNNIMPPPQSLIQGQDTQIWLEYPRFTPEATAVLGGAGGRRSMIAEAPRNLTSSSDALPLGDTSQYHYYHRYTVNVSLNTDDVNTDRVSVPCTVSLLRGLRDYQCTMVISSQSELVNIKVAPRQSNSNMLTWQDVSWKANSLAMSISLPRGIDVTVRFFEQDFRSLWHLVEYSRRVDHSLRTDRGEVLVQETGLVEVQYADSSNPHAFPSDKVKRCRAILWERFEEFRHSGALRKGHRGFRLAVVTEPGHKTLSSFTNEMCTNGPLFFEFITDAAAHGTTAMVIRVSEEKRQCRMLLVFHDMDSRQILYNKLNGIDIKEHETIVGKMTLSSLNIESLSAAMDGSQPGHSELSALQWQRLGITNRFVEDTSSRMPETVESESLRIVARHTHGCITDRINLEKGELMLRLPCTNTPTVQILRQPQRDLTMSVDARNAPHNVSDGVADVFRVTRNLPTVRTMTFASPTDLHAFEAAITGFSVRYDGLASNLAISRRRMVVPIYHKWTASNVRIQIVANAQSTVIQLLAFMEDFAHAEALIFQIKTTDNFESVKGDGKNKKWAVKMVDAKFTLPPATSSKDEVLSVEEKAKRRFVNLEGLDYAQEHDDITVGFDSQEGSSTLLTLNHTSRHSY